MVPAVAFLVLASFNMAGQIGSAREFGRGATIAEFGRQVTTLVHELQAERDLAAGCIAGGRPPNNQAKINAAIAQTRRSPRTTRTPDAAEAAVDVPAPDRGRSRCRPSSATWTPRCPATRPPPPTSATSGPQAAGRIDAARTQLDGLPRLRQALSRQLLTEGAIIGKYTGMITDAARTSTGEIGQRSGNRELSQQVAGLTALADLKETLSQERALLYSRRLGG